MNQRAEEVASRVGKKIKEIIPIKVAVRPAEEDTFLVTHAYEDKVKEMGYRMGSMQRSAPRALGSADKFDYIAKWHNIGSEDYDLLEGVVLCDDNRNGSEAEIVIFE